MYPRKAKSQAVCVWGGGGGGGGGGRGLCFQCWCSTRGHMHLSMTSKRMHTLYWKSVDYKDQPVWSTHTRKGQSDCSKDNFA